MDPHFIADKEAYLNLHSLPDLNIAIDRKDRAILCMQCFAIVRALEHCGYGLTGDKNSQKS